MTDLLYLDWAILAVSLINTMLLLWLGLTVMLNAEQRTPGVWIAGGALLLGGMFFLSHTVLVSYGYPSPSFGIEFWWRVGWLPVVCLPFAWYAVMLWYSGFWEAGSIGMRQRHRLWFPITLVTALGIVILLIFSQALPSVTQIRTLDISSSLSFGDVPVLFFIYPLYTILCTTLSLDALRRPGVPRRLMGEFARQRAWPWLAAASLALLMVSLLVGGTIAWVVLLARYHNYTSTVPITIGWLDLFIASLIAAATLFVGQAIASYEVFTGKALPRRGLLRYWQRAVMLAVGFSVLLSGILLLGFPQIYTVLTALILVVAFYALLSWRAYAEREHSFEALRPFISGQQLYAQILATGSDAAETSGSADQVSSDQTEDSVGQANYTIGAFYALCADMLGARLAYLLPMGELVPLIGRPLAYPPSAQVDIPVINELVAVLSDSTDLYVPLVPTAYAGAAWAIPLRSPRGLKGLLLLGEKTDGSLYAQEEMELARQAGESLLNARAAAEIAHRLVLLQRQRIGESQVVDQRARRLLHDEILPALHTTLLTLSVDSESNRQAIEALSDAHSKIARLLQELPTQVAPELTRLGLIGALQQLVEYSERSNFDQVSLLIDPAAEEPVHHLPPLIAEVLYYAAREAVRNAARHGRGAGFTQPQPPLRMEFTLRWQAGLLISIADNGIGLPASSPSRSYSTTASQSGGSGQGLALHSTLLTVIGGSLELTSASGQPTTVTIFLPETAIPKV